MKTAKVLMAAAGVAMASGSALAQRVDEDDLVGVWDTVFEGEEGSATLRLVLVESGQYLSLAITDDEEEPLPMWEVGTWELDGDEITLAALATSEEPLEDTVLTVEDTGRGELVFSSEEFGQIGFESAIDPVVGVWEANTDEGPATFLISCGGGFAGAFGDPDDEDKEEFWGRWERQRRGITFSVTDDEWTPDGDAGFDEYGGDLGDIEEDALMMSVEGLTDDEIEWERVAAHPLAGEWQGTVEEGMEITMTINDDGTFEAEAEGEEMVIEGVWTVAAADILVLGMIHEQQGEVRIFRFVLTGSGTMMMGQEGEELYEFERQ